MKKPVKIIFSFILLAVTICFSACPNPAKIEEETAYRPVSFPMAAAVTTPYLDILKRTIYNGTTYMEYSLDNQASWQGFSSAMESVSLTQGNQVWIRKKNDNSWLRSLGTVDALGEAGDLMVGATLFVGNFFAENSSWEDYNIAVPGASIDILGHFQNLGDLIAAETYSIEIYISDDRELTQDDTLIERINYENDSRIQRVDPLSYTIPADLAPGTYYIGMILDPANEVNELNEGNNRTLPEAMTPVIISDKETPSSGAFKVVNSWGTGIWENKDDGWYWLPYEVLKNNKMPIFVYANDFDKVYQPRVTALFQIDHDYRNEILVTFGVGDPLNPLASKSFEVRNRTMTYDGARPFPENKIALDITELAYCINDGDLYISVNNIGNSSGTLKAFSVEFNEANGASPFKILNCSSSNSTISPYSVLHRFIPTKDSLTTAQLQSISPEEAIGSSILNLNSISSSQAEADLKYMGIYQEGKDYTSRSGPFKTGYRPPTMEELEGSMTLNSIGTNTARASYNGQILPSSVDNSATNFFPPIGNQGGKGSCTAFSLAYYIQTYTEAKEHGWDLSSTVWGEDITGVSEAGSPQSNLNKIFSPDYLYHQINNGEDNGSSTIPALELILNQGCATWATTPYVNKWSNMTQSDYSYWPTEAGWREAGQYRGNRFGNYYFDSIRVAYFIIEEDSDIQMLKTLLSMGYIVSTSIDSVAFLGEWNASTETYTDGALDSQDVIDSRIMFRTATDENSGETYSVIDHAQTIVGYKEGDSWDSSNPDS